MDYWERRNYMVPPQQWAADHHQDLINHHPLFFLATSLYFSNWMMYRSCLLGPEEPELFLSFLFILSCCISLAYVYVFLFFFSVFTVCVCVSSYSPYAQNPAGATLPFLHTNGSQLHVRLLNIKISRSRYLKPNASMTIQEIRTEKYNFIIIWHIKSWLQYFCSFAISFKHFRPCSGCNLLFQTDRINATLQSTAN